MPRYKRGSGSIYKKKGNRMWWLSYYAEGRHICESSGTRDRSKARERLQQRIGQIAEGTFIGNRPDRVTYDEMSKDFLNDYEINSKKSLKDAERSARALGKYFKGRKAHSITTADIADFISARKKDELENSSINRELSALRRMFNLALQSGKIIRKPHVPMLAENNVRKGFFEWEDFESIRAKLPQYLIAPMTFAYLTGWRVRSEILTLRWTNVDFRAGTVRLEPGTTKNKEALVIYMNPLMKNLLEEELKRTKLLQRKFGRIVPLVFSNKKGKPIVNYSKAWGKACRQAGLPGKIPHDFRRTAVRNMVKAGIRERVAMQLTGHKTRSVFDRYHIVSDGDLKEASQQLYSSQLATILATTHPANTGKDDISS
jgi:integrase